MDSNRDSLATDAAPPDVYQRAEAALQELIQELCEALEVTDVEPFKRKGYEMVSHYFRQPVNTGELTLIFSAVLQDILHKLEMTQQSEHVTVVRDEYTVMKIEES